MTKNKLSIEEVKHVAKLANLPLSDEEIKIFDNQLSETINYMDDLSLLDQKIKSLKPTYQVTGKENELREDVAKASLPKELALQNAKRTYNGFFVVPSIWD